MAELTISQAIRKVNDIKGRLAKNHANASSSVLYLVKEQPAYSFKTELESAENHGRELLRLPTAIAVANATTHLEWEGKKIRLAYAVRRLEELKGQIKWYETLVVSAQSKKVDETYDYMVVAGSNDGPQRVKIEREWKCELPEADRAKLVQKLQDEFNRLNDQVETVNHRTSILLEG